MNDIKITIELSAEDRQLIKDLTAAVSAGKGTQQFITVNTAKAPAVVAEPETEPETAAEPAEEPAEVSPAPAEEPPKEETKKYTLDEVRGRVMALSRKSAAVKKAVKDALAKYSDSVTNLSPEQYGAFMTDLEAIQ